MTKKKTPDIDSGLEPESLPSPDRTPKETDRDWPLPPPPAEMTGADVRAAIAQADEERIREAQAEPKKPARYASLSSPEMLAAVGDNASKWADAFMELVVDRKATIDHGLMIGWFANAIEGAADHRRWRRGAEGGETSETLLLALESRCMAGGSAGLADIRAVLKALRG